MGIGAGLVLAALAAPGCAPAKPRVVEDTARGCRYEIPPGWTAFDGEIKSKSTSLATIRVFDLEDAERGFLARLPDSIVPQLLDWAKSYYIVEGEPARGAATIAGETALELTYPVRVRPESPPSKLIYWILRHEDRLYVVRATFAPGSLEADEPAIRAWLTSWSFLAQPATK